MIPLDDIDTIHNKFTLNIIAQKAEAYKPKTRTTYKMIKEYIDEKYRFKVHTAYIAEVKRDLDLPMYDAPNVRVLLGSTAKCGAGMNVQDRLIALHDLDCPWRPGDVGHSLRTVHYFVQSICKLIIY